MAKTSVSSVVPGQVGDIQRAAAAQTDERVMKEQAQQPASPPRGLQSLIEPTVAAESGPEAVANLSEGIEQGLLAQDAVRERNEVRPLQERAVDQSIQAGQWATPAGKERIKAPDGNGGIFARATSLGQRVETGAIRPRFGSEAYRQRMTEKGAANQLAAATESSSAMVDNTMDRDYAVMGSIVTENFLAQLAEGDADAESHDAVAEALGEPQQLPVQKKDRPKFSKAAQNERLGQEIHAEYSRMKNVREGRNADDFQPLEKSEAVTLGDAFKEMYAAANPDLLIRSTTPGGQTYFQLTDAGANALSASATIRKRMFPTQNVKPAKSPPQGGKLGGDVGRSAKPWSGKVGEQKGAEILEQAARNMSQIPNVVDKQRNKILMSTILPVLAGMELDPSLAEAYGEINNIGPSKYRKYQAAKKDQDRRRVIAQRDGKTFEEADYDPDATMEAVIDTVAQEVRAIQQERDGANYLTYRIAGFNGRMSPQQTYFDPTASKAVRFVTRNAVPSKAVKGNRVHKNLQQMYAMMLVKGADAKLPAERVRALEAARPQLYAWGLRLQEVLNNSMTDAEYDAIAQGIAEGKPLSELPVKPLALDPQQDAELIAAIKKKGEDGPHFIDGLIDFAKFDRAMRSGKPYFSYFNAYMDGKTNGIASNGVQMGHIETAEATGVLRNNKTDLLDDGDIRDKLKDELLDLIKNGWDGNVEGFTAELNDIAQAVFSWRDLNKATTMTFGYGKEIESFRQDIDATMGELAEIAASGDGDLIQQHGLETFNESLKNLEDNGIPRDYAAEILLKKYAVGLEQALSEEAIDSRAIMRSAAFLHALTDTLFTIKSPTGMDLNLGRNVSEGYESAAKHKYSFEIDGKKTSDITAAEYETRATSAAARRLGDREVPGEYAYGGSLPGPVQSLDASTVAQTVVGDSWKRLRNASQGNPYIHTIYDAFKVDANGFDVVFEEVNKNWLNTALDWSYLKEAQKSLEHNMREYLSNYRKDEARVLSDQEAEFMNYYLEEVPSQTSGRLWPAALVNKLTKLRTKPDGMENEDWFFENYKVAGQILKNMKAFGYAHGQPVTAEMRQHFYREMVHALDVGNRLQSMIRKTEANKQKLRQQLRERAPDKSETLGYDFSHGAQYYAH